MNVERRERIRTLNDLLRRHHVGGRIFLSRELTARGPDTITAALNMIRLVTEFTDANDPYGERDFGSVELNGERLFWKIDYYDQSLTSQATDPADPFQCMRIMTVMFAWEY
jgi:hypothetical protein